VTPAREGQQGGAAGARGRAASPEIRTMLEEAGQKK
jgi:hypothetical protein